MCGVSGMLKQDEGFYKAVAQIKLMKKKAVYQKKSSLLFLASL